MLRYIIYRLIFIFITLFCIVLVNFIVLNSQKIGAFEVAVINLENNLSGAKLEAKTIIQLKKHFNLQENVMVRFLKLYKNYLSFNLGTSYYSNTSVIEIILSKMIVSIPFGFFSTLIIYLLSILLGYFKSHYSKSKFDNISNLILVALYILPAFVIGSILILLFTPRMLLAILTNVCGGLLFITILSKNTFLALNQKTYYIFAQYKGLSKFQLFKNHLLKGFFLVIFADIASIFLGVLFGGSLFIEILFNLDGIGKLSYESIINKDYPIILGSIYLLSFLGLFLRLLNDIITMRIDKRIKMYEKNI
jgi:microcin C transport system permease protein